MALLDKFSPQLLFQLLNHRVTLLRAFGKTIQHLIAHALNLKAMFGRLNPVADLLHPFRQFIPINCRAVTDGVIHAAALAVPSSTAPLSSNVALNTVKCVCNCGSSRASCLCTKAAATRLPVVRSLLTALFPHSRGGESFEFAERNARGFLMRRHQSFVSPASPPAPRRISARHR